MKFITLTTAAHGLPILVNPDNVSLIAGATGGYSLICFVGHVPSEVVKETQEEIQKLCEAKRGLGIKSTYSPIKRRTRY